MSIGYDLFKELCLFRQKRTAHSPFTPGGGLEEVVVKAHTSTTEKTLKYTVKAIDKTKTIIIDWGDESDQTAIASDGAAVEVRHTYSKAGTWEIRLFNISEFSAISSVTTQIYANGIVSISTEKCPSFKALHIECYGNDTSGKSMSSTGLSFLSNTKLEKLELINVTKTTTSLIIDFSNCVALAEINIKDTNIKTPSSQYTTLDVGECSALSKLTVSAGSPLYFVFHHAGSMTIREYNGGSSSTYYTTATFASHIGSTHVSYKH